MASADVEGRADAAMFIAVMFIAVKSVAERIPPMSGLNVLDATCESIRDLETMKNIFQGWKLALVAFTIALASCASVEPTPPSPPQEQIPIQAPMAEDLGQQVARHLGIRYENKTVNCEAPSRPAFLCSGIMIRGTSSNPNYHVWNNSAASKAKGGVSFAYLRADATFGRMPYNYTNGFIFQSYSHVPAKLHPEVLCAFPIDGYTDARSAAGCGQHTTYSSSRPCDVVGITTAAQWWAAYNSRPTNRYQQQCGFDVRDSRNALAGPAFYASVQGRSYLSGGEANQNNEIIVKAWADNLGKTLPLEAFFYIYESTGKSVAQRNQEDLKSTDGILIPVISVRLSADPSRVTFYYRPEDQTEPMPPARRDPTESHLTDVKELDHES